MKEALATIIDRNLNYRARWNTSLANHVSMAAVAMYLMRHKTDVDEDKLYRDAETYSRVLSPSRVNDAHIALAEIPWTAQHQLLGLDDLHESWEDYFRALFLDELDANLQLWLHRLGRGLAAGAGHSLIRIHYALAARHALPHRLLIRELAVGFADFASRHLVLCTDDSAQATRRLEDYLDDHPSCAAEAGALVRHGTLIEDRFLLLRCSSTFQTTARDISLDFDLVQCLRKLASLVSDTQTDFTLLHAITVGQALLDTTSWAGTLDDTTLRQGYRDFVVATVMASNLGTTQTFDETNASLHDLYRRVTQLNDHHAQKATYSLTRLHEEFGYPEFLTAARAYQNAYG